MPTPNLLTETSISEQQNYEAVVIPASIVRIKDSSTGNTVTGIPISAYEARAFYSPTGIEMLSVLPGVPPFDAPVFGINNPGGVTNFTQFSVTGSEPPIAVSKLVPRLIGCALDTYDLEVTFDLIAEPAGGGIPEEESQVLTFQRGDIDGDGDVDIVDAMFGAQYVIGLRDIEDIRPLNMASVRHDGEDGDIMNIVDCMFIAQYVVGLRDCYFELVP